MGTALLKTEDSEIAVYCSNGLNDLPLGEKNSCKQTLDFSNIQWKTFIFPVTLSFM